MPHRADEETDVHTLERKGPRQTVPLRRVKLAPAEWVLECIRRSSLLAVMVLIGCESQSSKHDATFSLMQARLLLGTSLEAHRGQELGDVSNMHIKTLERAAAEFGCTIRTVEAAEFSFEDFFSSPRRRPVICFSSSGESYTVAARGIVAGEPHLFLAGGRGVSVAESAVQALDLRAVVYADSGSAYDEDNAIDRPYCSGGVAFTGVMAPAAPGEATLRVINPTSTPWIIKSARTSCGCTELAVEAGTVIEANGGLEVPVTVSGDTRASVQELVWLEFIPNGVLMDSDEELPGQPEPIVEEVLICGMRPAVAEVWPEIVSFGSLPRPLKDSTIRARIEVTEPPDDSFEITAVTCEGPFEVSVKTEPPDKASSRTHVVDISLSSFYGPPGSGRGALSIETTSTRFKTIHVPVKYHSQSLASPEPRSVRLEEADPRGVRATSITLHHNTQPLDIQIIEVSGPFKAELSYSADKPATMLSVRSEAGGDVIAVGAVKLLLKGDGVEERMRIPCLKPLN